MYVNTANLQNNLVSLNVSSYLQHVSANIIFLAF